MICPDNLKIGDTIGLIATSGYIKKEKLLLAISKIKKMNLEYILGKSCTEKFKIFAGDDKLRADDINYMFSNKNVKGIFVLKGGYGSQRIVKKIDFNIIKKNPKIFAGYSDITTLHNIINQKCNLITYHAPMFGVELYKNNIDKFTIDSFINNIFFNKKEYFIDTCEMKNLKILVKGNFKGILTGGNLSTITSSLGTDYEIDTDNKILFLEDVNEYPYKIDQKFIQLKNAKKLENIKGIILGHFTNCACKDENSFTVENIIKDIFLKLNKPCLYNFTCGHQLPNITLPLGAIIEFYNNKIKIVK